jgi:DNA-binding beta-propeller fold protein YncE
MEKSIYNQIFNRIKQLKISLIKISVAIVLLITIVYPVTECAAQPSPKRLLLALSKADHILAIINPLTLQIIERVPVGPDPHEVIASSDGSTAYVSNLGGGSFHELNIINLITQKALSNLDTKPLVGLHGLTFVDGKLWFTAEGAKSIGRYDPITGQIDWCMGTGQDRTHMIYVTPDGKHIYTTNVNAGTVSILVDSLLPPPVSPTGQTFPGAKPHMEWIQTIIPVSKGCEGFDVSPDGRELWTAASEDGSISIIDLATRKLTTKIDAKAMGANRLKFTPDGRRVMISSLRTGDLFIYDAESRQELKQFNIGHGAAGILMDPNGSRAFVGCSPDNYVAVVDLKSLQVTTHINLGGPDGLAWAVRP